VIVGPYCGYPTGAYVSDRIGRKRETVTFAMASFEIALMSTSAAPPEQ
jgi:hypothetical protein